MSDNFELSRIQSPLMRRFGTETAILSPGSAHPAAVPSEARRGSTMDRRSSPRAVDAGATVIRDLEDQEPLGLRIYSAEDLEGHRWMFGPPIARP